MSHSIIKCWQCHQHCDAMQCLTEMLVLKWWCSGKETVESAENFSLALRHLNFMNENKFPPLNSIDFPQNMQCFDHKTPIISLCIYVRWWSGAKLSWETLWNTSCGEILIIFLGCINSLALKWQNVWCVKIINKMKNPADVNGCFFYIFL